MQTRFDKASVGPEEFRDAMQVFTWRTPGSLQSYAPHPPTTPSNTNVPLPSTYLTLPPTSTLLQDIPYRHERKYNEGHKVTHVPTTTLGHHGVYPTKSASKQTPSIEHLPFHPTNQVILTAHLLLSVTKNSSKRPKTHDGWWQVWDEFVCCQELCLRRRKLWHLEGAQVNIVLLESTRSTPHQQRILSSKRVLR